METDGNQKLYKVVDGKQRLSTMLDFLDGNFPILHEDEEYYFADLDVIAQRKISLYSIVADVVYDDDAVDDVNVIIKEDWIIQWFKHINFLGTPMDKAHLDSPLTA